MAPIRIVGTGSHVPDQVLTNHDLETMVDTTDEWIVQRTGIKERRIAEAHMNTSDLAEQASVRALDAAGMSPEELDLIITATITPDTCCPSASNWLQAKLGAQNAVAFDVTAACTGFIFALSVAEQYLKNGAYKNALVIGVAETETDVKAAIFRFGCLASLFAGILASLSTDSALGRARLQCQGRRGYVHKSANKKGQKQPVSKAHIVTVL